MKVYELNQQKILQRIRDGDEPGKAFSGYLALRMYRFRREDLLAYGLAADDIAEMLDRGTLVEVDVDWREGLSILGYHRYRTDPDYRATVLANLEKAHRFCDPKVSSENIRYAHAAQMVPFEERRQKLLRGVILPEFGIRGENGRYSPPKEVSVAEVVLALQYHPRLLSLYPTGVYLSVRRDINKLGIGVVSHCGKAVSKAWKRMLKQDPKLRERAAARARHATDERKRLYKEKPEIAQTAYIASAETRRRKMQDDPEFRAATLRSLSMGNPAFRERYEIDEEFRESVRKKQLKGLAMGNKTKKKRAERRRKALRNLIEKRLGGLNNVSSGDVTSYIEERRPQFMRAYYDGLSLYRMVKRDLSYLRSEQD